MLSSLRRAQAALIFVAASAILVVPAVSALASDASLTAGTAPEEVVYSYVSPKPGVAFDPLVLAENVVAGVPSNFQRSSGPVPQAISVDWTHGDHKSIVILAEFSDIPHSAFGQTYYDDKLNYNGTSRTSARTWFYENSMGNYTLYTTVVGWVTLTHTQAYYDASLGLLSRDAAIAADSLVDFSQFDENQDGIVDNLVIIHSGGDQAAGCTPNCVWSQARQGNAAYVDGVQTRDFCTIADFGYPSGDSLGVWIHEFGHLGLGLPDLYDVYYENDGLGIWDMMAGGSWYLNHFSTWTKEWLGWVLPFTPTFNVESYTIYPATDSRYNPVKVTTNYTNEYFLIEMRADTNNRYETGIPYSGLLIEHIDTQRVAQGWNWGFFYDTAHKAIDIEEVGTQDMDGGGGTYSNDVWVNSVAGFNPTSTPNTNLYVNNNQYATGIRIYNISAVLTSGGIHMTFNIDTGRINFGLSGQVQGSPEKSATPGTSVTYPIEFRTASTAGDTINLAIEGVNQTLGSIDQGQLILGPLGSAVVSLTVNVPAAWSAGDTAWVQVRGTSATQGLVTFLVPTVTHASQTFGVDATETASLELYAVPDVLYPRSFTVRNLGNGVDNISVVANADPLLLALSVVNQPGVIGRGGSTAVMVEFTVQHSVPYLTLIPVQFDLRYGPSTGYLHYAFTVNVHVEKLSIVAVEIQAVAPALLYPETPRTYNVTIHNLGNYDAVFNLTTSSPVGVSATFGAAGISIPSFSDGVIAVTILADRDAPARSTGLVWLTARYSDVVVGAAANLSIQVTQRYEMVLTGDASFAGHPGAVGQFSLSAVNGGNGADTLTISFSPIFAEWSPLLSTTSLAVDTSLSGRTADFQFHATIPIDAGGNLRQTFVIQIRSNASGIIAIRELQVLVLPVYAFDATAAAAQGPIAGSESASFVLTFRNRGNVRDSYSVTIDGLPDGWSTEFAEGGITTVQAKGSGTSTLIVRPPSNAAADRYDFQIFVSSEVDLSRPIVIPLLVEIVAVRGIEIRTSNVDGEVRPGATVTLSVVVKNLGNVRENIFFQPTGSFGSVSVDPVQVSVAPFEERVVQVVVVLRSDQAAGATPLVIQASDVDHPDVTAEIAVDINVAAVTKAPATTPGFEGAAVIAVIGVVALVAVGTRRRRL